MHRFFVIVFAAALCKLVCLAQTNSPAPSEWFSLPPLQLRPLIVEPTLESAAEFSKADHWPRLDDRQLPATNSLGTSASEDADLYGLPSHNLTERITLTSPLGESDIRTYRMLAANGYLTRSAPESDNVFVRLANSVFEPTPVRIGKTTVAFSLITAIKKKNPLCLFNPIVLNISW